MLSNFLIFFYGFLLIISMLGWGILLCRAIRIRQRPEWSLLIAWGICFSIVIGGVLEITSMIRQFVLIPYLLAGLYFGVKEIFLYLKEHYPRKTFRIVLTVAYFLVMVSIWGLKYLRYAPQNSLNVFFSLSAIGLFVIIIWQILKAKGSPGGKKAILLRWTHRLVVFAIICLVLFRYAAWISTTFYNNHDDFHGYLVYPAKMIQTGSMGADPFSERRLVASLGGHYFLETFVLAAGFNMFFVHMIDPALAFVVLVLLIAGETRRQGVTPIAFYGLAFMICFINPPIVNSTSLVMGITLSVALFRTYLWEGLNELSWQKRSFLVALVASTLCSLRSSYVPVTGLTVFLIYFFRMFGNREARTAAIRECAMVATFSFFLLLPWMLSMYLSCGTLLYPILGKGFSGIRYGTFLSPSADVKIGEIPKLIADNLFGFPQFWGTLLMGVLCMIHFRWNAAKHSPVYSFIVGSIVASAVLVPMTGGVDISRYFFPILYSSMLIPMIAVLHKSNKDEIVPLINRITPVLTLILIGLFASFDYGPAVKNFLWCKYHIFWRENNIMRWDERWRTITSPNERERHVRMQSVIPAGATVLTRLQTPFLMDFKRNQVFIADYPGGSSLPPGMPFFVGPEKLASYLLSKNIRYVAYSYANEAGFPKKNFLFRTKPDVAPWFRTEAMHAFDYQDNMDALGKTRKHLYNDGDIFVLDLATTMENTGINIVKNTGS